MCKGKKKLYVISYGNQLFREALSEAAGRWTKIVRRSSKTSPCKGTCFAQALRLSGTYELFSGNYKAKLKYKSSC
jgi:hypothetical protein